MVRGMTPEDILQIRWLTDARLSPDGRLAACVVTTLDAEADEYRAAIWLTPTAAGEPRALTSGPGRDTAPRFSPDGRYLAFVRDVRGKQEREAQPQLWAIRVDGGEAWKLSDLPNGAAGPVWSPDGGAILVKSRATPEDGLSREERDRRRGQARVIETLGYRLNGEGFIYDRPWKLWRIGFDTSGPASATRLTEGEWSDSDPAWSPDGRRIAFVSARHEGRDRDHVSDLWVMPANGGEPLRVTRSTGPVSGPAWSPDGASLAYLGHEHATGGGFNTKLWLIPADGIASPRCLTERFDHTLVDGSLRWSLDGASLRVIAEDRGAQHLYQIAADGGPARLMAGGDRTIQEADWSGDRVLFSASHATEPAELFLVESDGSERRLTDLNATWKASVERPQSEPLRFTSADGTPIEGWLMKPVSYREGERYPVLFNIHGGPHAQYGHAFLDEFQVQAGHGYGVFFCNPRGSTGYGEQFARSVNGATGVVDYEDLVAGLDALTAQPWVDATRIGVLGGSYGGYLTSWLIGHTDRFRVACSERSVNNWLSKVGTSDIGHLQHEEVGAEPWEDPLHYLRRSPIFYVAGIRTPTLIMHSENDLRCPIEQGEQLYTALKLHGVPTRFVRFPEENHNLSRSGKPNRRLHRFELQLEWFDQYLT